METITIQAPNNEVIEKIKAYASTLEDVSIQSYSVDDLEDTRTEADIAETLVQNIKAIKEGKIKSRKLRAKEVIEELGLLK